MEILKSKMGSGFVLKLETELGNSYTSFTALEVCKLSMRTPSVVNGTDHKQTLYLSNPDKFWKQAGDSGVPVVYVSSSQGKEAQFIGEAA